MSRERKRGFDDGKVFCVLLDLLCSYAVIERVCTCKLCLRE